MGLHRGRGKLKREDDIGERLSRVEAICSRDVGGRGIEPLARHVLGDLHRAAASIAEHPNPRVAIVTGWFIPTASPPAPETDGLGGSVHLAAGLIGAGIPAMLVTDRPCERALRAAADAVEEEIPITAIEVSERAVVELGEEWRRFGPRPSHLVAVERVGPAADGRCYGQYGFDFTPHSAPFHRLFEGDEHSRGWTTIGVGDGGNEIGMGKLPRSLIEGAVPSGADIACQVACDYLLVCGVSNWGAIGLLAATALLRPDLKPRLIRHLNAHTDERILEHAVYRGLAVDGSPERQQMSVDGLPQSEHARVLASLVDLL